MGRPRVYEIGKLELGESHFIPWKRSTTGEILPYRKQRTIYAAIRQEERRFGKCFRTVSAWRSSKWTSVLMGQHIFDMSGLLVLRVA